jgi:hypothetical protein
MERPDLLTNIDNPRQLEKLYRNNKAAFKKEFNNVYSEIREKTTAQFWYERLNYEEEEISWGTRKDLVFVVIVSLIAGVVAKIPYLTGISEEFFYPRNISFIVFPFLTAYFAWKQEIQMKKLLVISAVFLVSSVYINLLPHDIKSDTVILTCIHLPIFLWATLGFTFTADRQNNYQGRLDFLRYNGDLLVMTGLILVAGAFLTAITFGLFELIGLNIKEFYFQNVGIWGLAAAPIVGTYLVRTNTQLVNKVSPVIAKVFTPFVFVMLIIYLVAVIHTGKDPYKDRDFLLIFNLLLIGVMAIIFFSIAENSKNSGSKTGTLLLLGLSVVTIIVNGIALSAILFRITEWGVTPNRLAILGGNILILTNLLIVTYRLFKAFLDITKAESVGKSIAAFLPVYVLWTIVVIFIFPFIFHFK